MPAGLNLLLISLLPPPTHDGVTPRRQWPNCERVYLAQTGDLPLGAGCVCGVGWGGGRTQSPFSDPCKVRGHILGSR